MVFRSDLFLLCFVIMKIMVFLFVCFLFLVV